MLPETFEVRRTARMLNTERFAAAIAELLVEHEVATLDDIDENAMIVDAIRVALLGQDYDDEVRDELNEQIGAMTRTSADVYDELPDGYSLCTAALRVRVTAANGVDMVVAKNARFVTRDPDLVAKYRLRPQFDRLDRQMERIAATVAEDVARIPALASRVPAMIAGSHAVIARELPAPASPNGGAS